MGRPWCLLLMHAYSSGDPHPCLPPWLESSHTGSHLLSSGSCPRPCVWASEVQGKLGFPSFLTGASGVAQEVSPWRIAALWIILPASCQPTGDGAAGELCSKLAWVEDPVNLRKCRPACAVTQAGPFSLGLSFPLCTACKGGGLSTGLA